MTVCFPLGCCSAEMRDSDNVLTKDKGGKERGSTTAIPAARDDVPTWFVTDHVLGDKVMWDTRVCRFSNCKRRWPEPSPVRARVIVVGLSVCVCVCAHVSLSIKAEISERAEDRDKRVSP